MSAWELSGAADYLTPESGCTATAATGCVGSAAYDSLESAQLKKSPERIIAIAIMRALFMGI